MQLLRQQSGTKVYMLEPHDFSVTLAKELMRIESNSYEVRFRPIVGRRIISSHFKLDPHSHVDVMRKRFTSSDSYWLVAYRHRKMVGYGMFKPNGRTVIVRNLHTDLMLANACRVGTAILLEGLEQAKKQGVHNFELWVERLSAQDNFPESWFKRMGMDRTGKNGRFMLGSAACMRHELRGKFERVLPYLSRHLSEFKG